jgi:hypothetical protein
VAGSRVRSLTESIRRIAAVVNWFHSLGKKLVTAAEVGDQCVKLGWKAAGTSNNGIGDHLGKRGLQLKRVSVTGGHAYVIPNGGITSEYLLGLGFDVYSMLGK